MNLLNRNESLAIWADTQVAFLRWREADAAAIEAVEALNQFDHDYPEPIQPDAVRDFSDLLDWAEAVERRATDRRPLDERRYRAQQAASQSYSDLKTLLHQMPHKTWYRIDRYRVHYNPNSFSAILIGEWDDDLLKTTV